MCDYGSSHCAMSHNLSKLFQRLFVDQCRKFVFRRNLATCEAAIQDTIMAIVTIVISVLASYICTSHSSISRILLMWCDVLPLNSPTFFHFGAVWRTAH